MKKDIHPEYKLAHVSCACGNVFQTRSSKGDIRVDICSKCPPFYTGQQRFVDTAGRVERFRKKFGKGKTEGVSSSQAEAPPPAGK